VSGPTRLTPRAKVQRNRHQNQSAKLPDRPSILFAIACGRAAVDTTAQARLSVLEIDCQNLPHHRVASDHNGDLAVPVIVWDEMEIIRAVWASHGQREWFGGFDPHLATMTKLASPSNGTKPGSRRAQRQEGGRPIKVYRLGGRKSVRVNTTTINAPARINADQRHSAGNSPGKWCVSSQSAPWTRRFRLLRRPLPILRVWPRATAAQTKFCLFPRPHHPQGVAANSSFKRRVGLRPRDSILRCRCTPEIRWSTIGS
jgi:hypothetical protein